jgi:hypothetical protein
VTKNDFYPDKISITEEIYDVKLQALLNPTANRLLGNTSDELRPGN